MATVQQHIAQWKHNRAFAQTIDRKYRDWQINVIFYTALHIIDAAMVTLNINVSVHTERNEEVKKNGTFASVRTQYLDLYRISRITRYDADPDSWLPQDYLSVTDLVESLLKPIENNLMPLIDKSFKPCPLKVDA